MIAIETIQKTAEALMAKAAIEIPDDYHDGLKSAAASEDGDLSSFVLSMPCWKIIKLPRKMAGLCVAIRERHVGM